MKTPFYIGVICSKARKDLWHARKDGVVNRHNHALCGAGKTAELAIADLQAQNRQVKREESAGITGGADHAPRARVSSFRTLGSLHIRALGSLHNGDETLVLVDDGGEIVISLETMKEIIRWAESKA